MYCNYIASNNFIVKTKYTFVEPDMWDLKKIVIPRIMNQWQDVAEALRYDLSIIKAIEEKGRGDPKKCCPELFRDWLTTKNGARAGKKVWSTLISVLKEIDDIAEHTVEDIISEVNQRKKFYLTADKA